MPTRLLFVIYARDLDVIIGKYFVLKLCTDMAIQPFMVFSVVRICRKKTLNLCVQQLC